MARRRGTQRRGSSNKKRKASASTTHRAKRSLTSGLSPRINRLRNTKTHRKRMSPTSFALPGQRKYRIDTRAHARNALARVAQHGTPSQQQRVRAAVHRKYPGIKQRH